MQNQRRAKEIVYTILILGVTAMLMSINFWQVNENNTKDKNYIDRIYQYRIMTRNLIVNHNVGEMNQELAELRRKLPIKNDKIIMQLQNIEVIWTRIKDQFNKKADPTKNITTMLGANDILLSIYNNIAKSRPVNNDTGFILNIIVLLLIFVLGFQIYNQEKKQLEYNAKQKQKNQTDINLLLGEVKKLADGDLAVQATVQQGITAAIADTINYTINALRRLVYSINVTAAEVSNSAMEVQETAKLLAQASSDQAQEIVAATQAVNTMTLSIEHVSSSANKSADVADSSLNIAKDGVQVVQDTIGGMDRIRDQIQETAKMIKRLGESSQEIGDMVSLIDDIADQTNILSLNASIQAAMAGEAGRGFAVVADEVQRLAERSGNATKEISSLVANIQLDTNKAVVSMEQTTVEVIKGAKLAENAGVALARVEKVSNDLANLIEGISNAATQQAATSAKISKTMGVIQSIATQTASGAAGTSESINNLIDLVVDLQDSVAGFQLPKDIDNND